MRKKRAILAAPKADGETAGGVAEYRRLDECEFVIPEVSFLPELDQHGKVNKLRAYSLLWSVPNVADSRGAVLRFHRVVVKMRNEGANSLIVNAMQPHGYEVSPGTVAAWTSLQSGTLAVGEEMTLVMNPVVNNFVVPLRTLAGHSDCIVVFTMTVARQYVTQAGNVVSDAALQREVGLRATVKAYYDSSGNRLENGKYFQVRSGDAANVFSVRSNPPLPRSAGQLLGMFPTTARVSGIGFSRQTFSISTAAYNAYVLVWLDAVAGVIANVSEDVLATEVAYRMPGVYALANQSDNGLPTIGRYVRWFAAAGRFVLCVTPLQAVENVVCRAPPAGPQVVTFDLGVNLTPVTTEAWTSLQQNDRRLKPHPVPKSSPGGLGVGTWQDDLVSAVTFVVKVLKVVSMVAGAVGFLDVVGVPRDGASSLSDFEL